MNTENLKEFIVLAETKNFWEASERLYMNQSTLSKHIKSLENDLGVALFTRTTRRVELTNYGEIFLPYAKSVTRSEVEGISAIQRMVFSPSVRFLLCHSITSLSFLHNFRNYTPKLPYGSQKMIL